jgi:hypothetical protein
MLIVLVHVPSTHQPAPFPLCRLAWPPPLFPASATRPRFGASARKAIPTNAKQIHDLTLLIRLTSVRCFSTFNALAMFFRLRVVSSNFRLKRRKEVMANEPSLYFNSTWDILDWFSMIRSRVLSWPGKGKKQGNGQRKEEKKKETLNVGEEKVSFYQFPEILKKQL